MTCVKTNARSKGTPFKVKLEDLYIIAKRGKQENETSSNSSNEMLNQENHTEENAGIYEDIEEDNREPEDTKQRRSK